MTFYKCPFYWKCLKKCISVMIFRLTRALGMDCEMVGVGDGTDSVLARVSIVNQFGEPVYDKFVKPKEKVVDYRTQISGVRPEDLKNGIPK